MNAQNVSQRRVTGKTVRTVRLALALAFLAAVLAAVLLHASLFFLASSPLFDRANDRIKLAPRSLKTVEDPFLGLCALGLKGFKFAPHTLDY